MSCRGMLYDEKKELEKIPSSSLAQTQSVLHLLRRRRFYTSLRHRRFFAWLRFRRFFASLRGRQNLIPKAFQPLFNLRAFCAYLMSVDAEALLDVGVWEGFLHVVLATCQS